MAKITRKRRHEAMFQQGMHAGNTDAKFDPPPQKPLGRDTTDIVERLENYAKLEMPRYPNDICSDAKREIAHLRAEVSLLKGALVELDAYLDFSDEDLANGAWAFEDVSGIRAAFERAKMALQSERV